MSTPLPIERSQPHWITVVGAGFSSLWLCLLVALFDVALQWVNIHSLSFGTPASFNLLTMDLAMAVLRAQMGVLALWLLIGTDRLPLRLALFVGGYCWLYWVFTGLFFARMFPADSPSTTWYRFTGYLPLEYMLIQGPVMLFAFVFVAICMRRFGPANTKLAKPRAEISWYQFTIVDFLIWSGVIGLVAMACHVPEPLKEESWIGEVLTQWRVRGLSSWLRILIATFTAATVLFAARAAVDSTGERWKYVPLLALGLGAIIDIISLSISPELLRYGWAPFQQRLPEALLQPLVGALSLLLWRLLRAPSLTLAATTAK